MPTAIGAAATAVEQPGSALRPGQQPVAGSSQLAPGPSAPPCSSPPGNTAAGGATASGSAPGCEAAGLLQAREPPQPSGATEPASAAPEDGSMAAGEGGGADDVPTLSKCWKNRESRSALPMLCHVAGCGLDLQSHPEY